MRILTLVLSIVAGVAGLVIGGLILLLAYACRREASQRGCALQLVGVGLVEIGLPAYALWQASGGDGGLGAALLSLALSLGLALLLPGVAYNLNP